MLFYFVKMASGFELNSNVFHVSVIDQSYTGNSFSETRPVYNNTTAIPQPTVQLNFSHMGQCNQLGNGQNPGKL